MATSTANDISHAQPHPNRGFHVTAYITLDDDLLCKARAYTGITEPSALIDHALKCLVEREASRQLARLHGFAPGLADQRAAGANR